MTAGTATRTSPIITFGSHKFKIVTLLWTVSNSPKCLF